MRTLPIPHTAVVHGDARCFSIACASILAKVTRDHLMTRLGLRYPHYIWDHNAGYTTRDHVNGLASHGITAHHRRSFCRISDLLLEVRRQEELEVHAEIILADMAGEPADDAAHGGFELGAEVAADEQRAT